MVAEGRWAVAAGSLKVYGIMNTVPFHLGKHKPVATKHIAFDIKRRVQVAAWGSILSVLGALLLWRGFRLVIDINALTIYGGALITTGAMLMLFAVIPSSWINKTVDWLHPIITKRAVWW